MGVDVAGLCAEDANGSNGEDIAAVQEARGDGAQASAGSIHDDSDGSVCPRNERVGEFVFSVGGRAYGNAERGRLAGGRKSTVQPEVETVLANHESS